MFRKVLFIIVLSVSYAVVNAQSTGDTITVGDKKVTITSNNLIVNSGFENGFTGWTDGTNSELSSDYFSVVTNGGVNNSSYLVGTTNSGNTSAGALSTGWTLSPQKTYYFSYHVKYQNSSIEATPEVWLKTSLTNDANLQEETYKLIDTTYVNAGEGWTKNAVVFTNSSDYTYLVARFRWLNNRFGFDDFTLYEVDEIRNTEGLQLVIDKANTMYNSTANGAEALLEEINNAENRLPNGSVAEINQAIQNLRNALFLYEVANATGDIPQVSTYPYLARGSTMIFGRTTLNAAADSFLEHGLCWSTHSNPTIFDNRSTKHFDNNGPVYHIENLSPSSIYYVRGYAISPEKVVGYGDVQKVITLPRGTVTYNLSNNVSDEHRNRIDNAVGTAVEYINELTSIQGHSLSVNYGSGTPTAEASYGGWMRFGPSESYQRTGTALHEIGHTIGVGTHSMWYGPSSPLRETGSRGAWLGDRTTELLQFLDNDPESYLRGDDTHMWPYGVNGAHEDNGTEYLYIANALIAQALGEDGLPPTGGFATPAYTLPIENGTKYYIKSEDEQTGLLTSFVAVGNNGNLINSPMTPSEASKDDYAAWYISFDPTNGYYTFQNVATGRYFTFFDDGTNGIGTSDDSSLNDDVYFQLMRSRIDANFESLTKRGYWIIHPERNATPPSLTAGASANTFTSDFDITNSASAQRWLILSEEDFEELGVITANASMVGVNQESIVYSKAKKIYIESQISSSFKVFSINGRLMVQGEVGSIFVSGPLPHGMYVVVIESGIGNEVKKIIVQ